MQRSGRARHHTNQRGRFDDMGVFSQGQPRRAVTGSPLPGLKEFQREPSGPLATYSVYARQKPKQKPEGLGGKLLKMRHEDLAVLLDFVVKRENSSQAETTVS